TRVAAVRQAPGANDRGNLAPIEDVDDPEPRGPIPAELLVQQIRETADKLLRDGTSRTDVKLLSTTLKELRYALKVFAAYRSKRKVSIFGSTRTSSSHAAYRQAVEFGRQVAQAGFMVMTGAVGGICEAGHVGAGRENSIGINILLPYETES